MAGVHSSGICPNCNNQDADAFWDSRYGNKISCKECGFDSDWNMSESDKMKIQLRKLSNKGLFEIHHFISEMLEYRLEQEKRIIQRREEA